MNSVIKQLVAFKNATDVHRVIYQCKHDAQYNPKQFYVSSNSFIALKAHVDTILGARGRFIDYELVYDTSQSGGLTMQYCFRFDVLSGDDAAMLKLAEPPMFRITAFKFQKPERFPGEYCRRRRNVVHSGFQKHQHKGHK